MTDREVLRDQGPAVAGHCPMGCGRTLFLGSEGHVTCARIACPDPVAVDRLLSVPPETGHIFTQADDDTFTLEHPLRERVGGSLAECELHNYLTSLVGPPVGPGRYRVIRTRELAGPEHGWAFMEMREAEIEKENEG